MLLAATAHLLDVSAGQVAVCCLLSWIAIYSVRCASPRVLTHAQSRADPELSMQGPCKPRIC